MTKNGFSVCAILCMFAGSALADDLVFKNPGNNIWWPGRVYVSPYTAHDSTTNQDLAIYCVDYNHEIGVNTHWTADILALTLANLPNFYYADSTFAYNLGYNPSTHKVFAIASGSAPQDATHFLTPDPFHRYLEAAWLISQSELAQRQANAHAITAAAAKIKQQVYNIAAWSLFIDAKPPTPGNLPTSFINAINSSSNLAPDFALQIYNAVVAAESAVGNGFTAHNWYVVTPDPKTDGNLTQEFLIHKTPEPGSLLLFGAVAGILSLRWWKRKKPQPA